MIPSNSDSLDDQNELPLITIITPSFNQAKYIERTLLSVKEQSYKNIDHIVVDGGSTDGTLDILRQYENTYPMRWLSEPDEGQADAINKGYRMAQGKLIGWLNSDDTYILPDGIKCIVQGYQKNPQGRLYYGDAKVTDEQDQVKFIYRHRNWNLETLLLGTALTQPTFFVTQELLSEVGLLDQTQHYALDWSFTIRIFTHYRPEHLIYVPDFVASSREYADTKSRLGGKKITAEKRDFLRQYYQRTDLPNAALKLHNKAFMATYWSEAWGEYHLKHWGSIIVAVWNALKFDPFSIVTRFPFKAYKLLTGKYGRN